jgi:hypothetical protein
MNVDNFKSLVSKRGGLAPSNRYAVYMPLPLINFDPQELIAKAFNRGNNASGNREFFNDPRDVSILCDSVTMPGRQISTTELSNNMLSLKMPYNYINDDVTMSFHITNDHFMKKFFDKWTDSIFDRRKMTMKYRSSYATDIIIQQLDQRDVPIYTCTLKNAYPITVSSYELSNSGENQFQKLSVTFTYEDWSQEGFVESILSKGKVLLGSAGKTLQSFGL